MNILGILFLAVLIEGTLAYLLGKSTEDTGARVWVKYVALVIGAALAAAYKIDIPAMVELSTPLPIINYVISGIIIGRGSNYVNDIVTSFQKRK